MKNEPPKPNRQTIAELHGFHHDFAGTCMPCRRRIIVDMEQLIACLGPDALVREAANRIKCKTCGAHVHVVVSNAGARGEQPPSYSHLR